jgi:drug/metabolite transporter (DMT)-like permease
MRGLTQTSLGVLLGLCAYAAYSTGDAMVKGLGGTLGVFEIGFFTTIFSILPAVFTKPKAERWRDTFKLSHPFLVHLIAVCRTISAILAVFAFVTIPLAEAYCIIFLIPVFITILSVVVLKEEVSAGRWGLALLSFVGVLIVVRPGFQALELGHLGAFACAITAAISATATRMISGTEKRTSLFVIPGLYTLAVNGALLGFGFTAPTWFELFALLVCGVLGGAGYLFQIAALVKAPANRVAPMQYSQIVWALIFGALFFKEVPDAVGLVGLSIVVASGIAGIFSDGARARIAGRWAEFRGRRGEVARPGDVGPGPDAV